MLIRNAKIKRKWVDYGEVSVYNYRRDRNSRKTGGELAKLSKEFRSKITLKTDTKQADAEKLMAVMALGIRHGQTINVEIDGTDEKTAAEAVRKFFEAKL